MLIDASLQEKAILKEISGRVKQCRIGLEMPLLTNGLWTEVSHS